MVLTTIVSVTFRFGYKTESTSLESWTAPQRIVLNLRSAPPKLTCFVLVDSNPNLFLDQANLRNYLNSRRNKKNNLILPFNQTQ